MSYGRYVGTSLLERYESMRAIEKTSLGQLARRAQKRTAELAQANRDLRLEIAERKRADKETAQLLQREKEARRKAEDANRLKDEFLATVSHELRSPVNVVVGYASILLQSEEGEKSELIRHAAETIQRNALAQGRLISDLFNLSRLRVGKLLLDCQAISLNPIINEAVDAVRAEAKAKDVLLRSTCQQSLFLSMETQSDFSRFFGIYSAMRLSLPPKVDG